MPQAQSLPDEPRRPRARLAVALTALATLSGCQTTNPISLWRMGVDDSLSKGPTKAELGDDRGLMARWLTPRSVPPTDPAKTTPLVKGPNGWEPPKVAPNPEAESAFQAAEKLFQQGKLVEAESAFATMAKKHKGTPWGEKAQFFLAETQFQRGRYVYAHDNFEKLVADYPGTNYLDKLVSREYAIAQIWLALGDPNAKPEQRIHWTGRFNGSRPLIDTAGYARQALEHVRNHDATHDDGGQLGDDATMQLAESHMKVQDYEAAAEYYDQLTKMYPKSPFLQKAQHAYIDAHIKGYIGPEYDGAGLDKARERIKETMAAFPDRPEGNERLYHTLDLINDQMAERAYTVGAYYQKVGKVTAAEYYFGMLPQKWPKSPWTVKAKTQLAELAKMPRQKTLPSKIMTQPGTADPFSGSGGMGGTNGMGMGGMGMGGMGGMGMPGGMY